LRRCGENICYISKRNERLAEDLLDVGDNYAGRVKNHGTAGRGIAFLRVNGSEDKVRNYRVFAVCGVSIKFYREDLLNYSRRIA
jgi:hypothetical protein